MTLYVKAPLGEGGILELKGTMETVKDRADATEVVYGDAAFFLERAQASNGWPELDWKIEKVGEAKYIVKGTKSQ